jgi:hypothetical protein
MDRPCGVVVRLPGCRLSGPEGGMSMLGGSPCHHGMARPRVADGRDGFQQWSVAANILDKQPRSNDKGWSYSLGVGRRG